MYCSLLLEKKLEDTILTMNNNIQSNIIHTVWSSVAAINKTALLQLNDADLTHQIMNQVEKMSSLSLEDRQPLAEYIHSKILLIRDIADS